MVFLENVRHKLQCESCRKGDEPVSVSGYDCQPFPRSLIDSESCKVTSNVYSD